MSECVISQCALCGGEIKRPGSLYDHHLNEFVFCDDCRARLLKLIGKEAKK